MDDSLVEQLKMAFGIELGSETHECVGDLGS